MKFRFPSRIKINESPVLIQDLIFLAICFGLAWFMPGLGEPFVGLIEKRFAQFARNKWVALPAVGSAVVIVRLALLKWIPVPQPKVHDEFSYLLAGDTFAHGRLANPPHPLWIFFDTFHVLQHPTYASIYPPAQGVVLAIGKLLGQPWIGILLSTAVMCTAITWMLEGWMQAEWAVLGGTLVLFKFGIFSYWMNSYWGGSIAAAGAALVMGALPRFLKNQRLRDAVILGLGAGILATSRPFEGFIFCIPVAAALLWWYLRLMTPAQNANVRSAFLALTSILLCVIGFIAYYNWRVTGNPLKFPVMIEAQSYVTTPVFVWQQSRPRLDYANPQFEDFYNTWMPTLYRRSWNDAINISCVKFVTFWRFFLGPAFSIPILTLPWLLGDRKIRLLLFQFTLSWAGLLATVWFHSHYAAPLLATVMLLVMLGMRHLRKWCYHERPVGIELVRFIVLFSILIGPVYFAISRSRSFSKYLIFSTEGLPDRLALGITITILALFLLRLRFKGAVLSIAGRAGRLAFLEFLFLTLTMAQICIGERVLHPIDYAFNISWISSPRAAVERRLTALPGEHLVLVRYSPDHSFHDEYVYNDADIDHAKTVWAREIPDRDLNPLLTHFRNRDVWVLEPDETPFRLYPYSPGKP